MDELVIPNYTDDDLKDVFTPEDCVEILKHMGYEIEESKDRLDKNAKRFCYWG